MKFGVPRDFVINSEQIIPIPELKGNVIMKFYYGFADYNPILQDVLIDNNLKGYAKLLNKIRSHSESPEHKIRSPEGVWFSLMYFQNTTNDITLIGFYYGTEQDNYLEISENYRGSKLKEINIKLTKGLCRLFSGFTFNQVITQLNVDSIRLYNAAGTPGCICYAKAAIDYNFAPLNIFDEPINPQTECVPSHTGIVIKRK